jgi:ferredoxin
MDVIRVDLDRCVGHGKCYLLAPELIEPFDDEGHAEWVGDPVDDEDAKGGRLLDRIVASCPEEALSRHRLDHD